jgi:hypothetical protein
MTQLPRTLERISLKLPVAGQIITDGEEARSAGHGQPAPPLFLISHARLDGFDLTYRIKHDSR